MILVQEPLQLKKQKRMTMKCQVCKNICCSSLPPWSTIYVKVWMNWWWSSLKLVVEQFESGGGAVWKVGVSDHDILGSNWKHPHNFQSKKNPFIHSLWLKKAVIIAYYFLYYFQCLYRTLMSHQKLRSRALVQFPWQQKFPCFHGNKNSLFPVNFSAVIKVNC